MVCMLGKATLRAGALVTIYVTGVYEANAIQRGVLADDHKGHTAPVITGTTSALSTGSSTFQSTTLVLRTITGPAIAVPPRDTSRPAVASPQRSRSSLT
jgi:hypothetical protein